MTGTVETMNTSERLLRRYAELADRGASQQEIAAELGFHTTTTLTHHLLRASQETGRAVPPIVKRSWRAAQFVEVRRRGRREAFGVNVPEEPLGRIGAKPGDRLVVTVTRRRITLKLRSARRRRIHLRARRGWSRSARRAKPEPNPGSPRADSYQRPPLDPGPPAAERIRTRL